jgi:hypothetical protein
LGRHPDINGTRSVAPDAVLSETDPVSETGRKVRSVPDAVTLQRPDLTDFITTNLEGAGWPRR